MAHDSGFSGDGIKFRAEERRLGRRGRINDANREWAKRRLEQLAMRPTVIVEPVITAAPAKSKRKAKRPKSKSRGAKSAVRAEAAAQSMVNQVVTPETQAKGDYRPVDFKLHEAIEGGKRKETTIRVVRNLGGTPVERWHSRGAFDERQWQAIIKYISLHCTAFGPGQRVTANYCPAIVHGGRGSVEEAGHRALDAIAILRLLDNEVFFREPAEHFWVWQNVLIFDEPAGVAGSRCGYNHKGAEAVAREIVRTLAWKVAEILVDQPLPRDMRDMLLDLDAPRRPGRRG